MKLIAVAILLLPLVCSAEVYKCQKDGKTLFSDKPCGAGSKESTVDIKVAPVQVTIKNEQAEKKRREVDKLVKTRIISDEIERAEDRMRQLNDAMEMEKELAALQQSKKSSNNNLAGATRDNAISSEMQAVTTRYANKIAVEKIEIERLQKERDSIKDN